MQHQSGVGRDVPPAGGDLGGVVACRLAAGTSGALQAVLAEPGEGVTVRGTYSLIGLNANADLMVWTVALELEALQDYAVRLARTPLGRQLDMKYNYFVLVGLSLY